jgi:hypothetical protein
MYPEDDDPVATFFLAPLTSPSDKITQRYSPSSTALGAARASSSGSPLGA